MGPSLILFLPALGGALLSSGTDRVFVRGEGVAVTAFRELRLADTVLDRAVSFTKVLPYL